MSTARNLSNSKRIVVKIGSALLVHDDGRLRADWLDALAQDIAALRSSGAEVMIVSSGAIAIGRRLLGLASGPRNRALRLEESQAAAATDQVRLAHAWQETLGQCDVPVAQILLTIEDTEDRRRHLNARNTIGTLLRLGVVPVINENDTIATDEIRFGDNDRLAARVAQMMGADTCVILSDIDGSRLAKALGLLADMYGADQVGASVFDVTDYLSVEEAFGKISCQFGGIDILVPNAGIAHVARIETLEPEKLDQVIAVNLKGTFTVIKAAISIFRRQGTGGNIVLISSKNVFDPGAAFGAYSAAKAGAHQIGKIAAMELAGLGVRVNMINPDAVFGDGRVSSKLWDEIGPDRMRSRGLDAQGLKDYYRKRSLLKVEVLGEHVGNAVVFFASELTPTTGASLPVDAGNSAAFPR